MLMIQRISVVWAAVAVLGFVGCGGNGAAPSKSTGGRQPTETQAERAAPTEQTPVISPAIANEPAQPTDAPSQPADVSKTSPATETPKPESPKPETAQDLFAKVQDLQTQLAQVRTPQELVTKQRSILELCDKILAMDPEPALRDQARGVWFEAAAGMRSVTRFESKRAANLLDRIDKLADAILAESPSGENVATAQLHKILGHLHVERDGSESDPAVNKRLFQWTKEFADKFPKDRNVAMLLYLIGENAENDKQLDTAREIYRFGSELDLGDPRAAQGFQASLRWLDLNDSIGKPVAITGPTLDGSEVNLAELKGKVVLVDFWATWCGPCLGELPNVQKVYEQYHDEGFEIIAVSLDRTKDALEKFVADRKLPWPQIFFDEEGKRFWENPIAQQYGIQGIPQTLLIGRDGKLSKIGVRGPALETAVTELLKTPKAPQAN